MNDVSESNHRRFLEEGRRALARKKAELRAARFTSGKEAAKIRRNIYDNDAINPYAARRARAAAAPRLNVKGTTIAAFMWMPQFKLSLRGFAHVYPVFIRMMALLLLQAGLIPEQHPSLAYGAPEVPRVGFRKLMGEAWFRLRTIRASYGQYGVFAVAMMTVAVLVSAISTVLARAFLGLGDVAQAQLFFTHPGDPYGAGAGKTDLAAVKTISGAPSLFDTRVSGSNISTDYGLMVLDKILRQAGADTPNGGALQNALAGMMKGYNAGVSIVAAVMIFWMIVSIVLDTAKTGVFGGRRHNMVWAPIRVIFALGLMFPLGSGFSSGQYFVMKLAEWGSNFGTRGWTAYVEGVVGDKSLLMPFSVGNASAVVSGVSKVMVCQVAYNTYVMQSTGALDSDQAIQAVKDTDTTTMYVTNRYTNKTASDVCGKISYGTDANADDASKITNFDPSTPTTPMTASTSILSATDYTNRNAGLAAAMTGFRNAMRAALKNDFNDTAAGNKGSGGTVLEMARTFACQFVSRRFPDGGTSNPVGAIPQCTGQGTLAADPDASQHQAMVDKVMDHMNAAYDGPAKTALMTYITGSTGMVAEMKKRGWAGMGMWYQDISAMSGVISSAGAVPVSYEPGAIWTSAGSSNWLRCAGNKILGRACRISGLEEKVYTVMGEYDRWWSTASVPGAAGNTVQDPTKRNRQITESSGDGNGVISFIHWVESAKGDNSLADKLARLVLPSISDTMIFDPIDLAATNTYPLAQLADIGHSILGVGLLIWTGVTVVQAVSTISGLTFSAGMGLASSALINGLATIGTALVTSGIMIAFYLPILPFLRVAFAVLTWMTSVFEAVVMVPIAALCHLTSTGEGLAGQARTCWILWLNVLMRPILAVMGFVGGMLIYNSFALYFNQSFGQNATSLMSAQNYYFEILAKVTYSIIYLAVLYTAANTSFKLLDVLPNALMRYMGGQPDVPMDKHSDGGMLMAVRQMKNLQPGFSPKSVNNDPNDPNSGASRADRMRAGEDKALTDRERQQAAQDTQKAYDRMSAEDRTKYNSLSGQDQRDFAAQKFLEQESARHVRLGFGKGADGKFGWGNAGSGGLGEAGRGANFGMRAARDEIRADMQRPWMSWRK